MTFLAAWSFSEISCLPINDLEAGPDPDISDQGGKKDKISDNFRQKFRQFPTKFPTTDCKKINLLLNLLFKSGVIERLTCWQSKIL